MSAFSEFNGPQQGMSGSALAQLTAMIESFNKLSAQLQAHVEKAVSDVTDVHNVKAYVDNAKANITAAYTSYITDKITIIDEHFSLIESSIRDKADATAMSTQIQAIQNSINTIQNTLSNCVSTNEFSSAITEINGTLATVQASLNNFLAHWNIDNTKATFDKPLKVSEITAKVKALNAIDFVKWAEFQAPYAGTGGQDAGTQGVYVLGCLSENWSEDSAAPVSSVYKPARIYVKYVNSTPFDAIIDAVVTQKDGAYTGTITAKVAKKAGTWEDMAFHIVRGTGTQGQEQTDKMYLCISSKGLAVQRDSEETVTITQATFKVACENFCAVGQEGYVRPNGMLHNITTCKIGTAASGITAIDKLAAGSVDIDILSIETVNDKDGKHIFSVEKQDIPERGVLVTHRYMFMGNTDYDKLVLSTIPYLLTVDEQGGIHQSRFTTTDDAQNMQVPVGGIIRWINMNKLPSGYLACNGTTISAADYPELAEVIGEGGGLFTLPTEEHSIIKYTAGSINNNVVDPMPSFISLATLDAKISEETDRAEDAELQLRSDIDSAAATIQVLDESISDEVTRAKAAEQTNATKIAEVESKADDANDKADSNTAAIQAEVTRAKAAEQTNATKIAEVESKANDAQDKADSASDKADNNTTAIQTEITRATEAEQSLNDRISSYHPGE